MKRYHAWKRSFVLALPGALLLLAFFATAVTTSAGFEPAAALSTVPAPNVIDPALSPQAALDAFTTAGFTGTKYIVRSNGLPVLASGAVFAADEVVAYQIPKAGSDAEITDDVVLWIKVQAALLDLGDRGSPGEGAASTIVPALEGLTVSKAVYVASVEHDYEIKVLADISDPLSTGRPPTPPECLLKKVAHQTPAATTVQSSAFIGIVTYDLHKIYYIAAAVIGLALLAVGAYYLSKQLKVSRLQNPSQGSSAR